MKKNLNEAGVPYEEVNIETPDGREKAKKFHVTSLPTLIIFYGDEPSSFVGVYPVWKLRYLRPTARSHRPGGWTSQYDKEPGGEAEKAEKSGIK
jgi:hypothetical protein